MKPKNKQRTTPQFNVLYPIIYNLGHNELIYFEHNRFQLVLKIKKKLYIDPHSSLALPN